MHLAIHQLAASTLKPVSAQIQRDIEAASPLPRALKHTALAALERLPGGDVLCHMDLHPDQVILAQDRAVVIDWLTAGSGHPAADVARTTMLLRLSTLPEMSVWMRTLITTLRAYFLERYLRCYTVQSTTVTRRDVEAWLYPIVAARLCEGIGSEEATMIGFLQRNAPANAGR